MGNRLVPLAPSEFYHVYNRGTDKRAIFMDVGDYRRFLEILYLCNTSSAINVRDIRRVHASVYEFERANTLVSIGAYCLMPNHFHILMNTSVEGGITMFMSKVSTAYSMYFNKRYNRSGALFQGRFKSEHANTDEYLKYLYAYIHLNPVKLIDPSWKEKGSRDSVKSFTFASSYTYSSLPDYVGAGRPESKILNKASFPEYFATATNHRTELFDWLQYT